MTAPVNKVSLVLDSDVGDRLSELASDSHVWLIDAPANRAAASKYRARNPKGGAGSGVTTFRASDDTSDLEKCLGVLGTIDLHHGEYSSDPPYSILEVVGLPRSREVISALENLGFKNFEDTEAGFRAER